MELQGKIIGQGQKTHRNDSWSMIHTLFDDLNREIKFSINYKAMKKTFGITTRFKNVDLLFVRSNNFEQIIEVRQN